MINTRICFAALPFLLVCFAACSDDDGDNGGAQTGADGGASSSSSSSGGGGSSEAGASMDASPEASSSSTQVFTIDGVASTSQDKIAVSTFTSDRVALNFGVQVLTAPTDYTFLLTFRLDETKTTSGTFGMEAVQSVEGLLRNAQTAATYSTQWEPDDTQGVTVELSVANDKITARWLGPVTQVGAAEIKTVEARTVDLPSTKK